MDRAFLFNKQLLLPENVWTFFFPQHKAEKRHPAGCIHLPPHHPCPCRNLEAVPSFTDSLGALSPCLAIAAYPGPRAVCRRAGTNEGLPLTKHFLSCSQYTVGAVWDQSSSEAQKKPNNRQGKPPAPSRQHCSSGHLHVPSLLHFLCPRAGEQQGGQVHNNRLVPGCWMCLVYEAAQSLGLWIWTGTALIWLLPGTASTAPAILPAPCCAFGAMPGAPCLATDQRGQKWFFCVLNGSCSFYASIL